MNFCSSKEIRARQVDTINVAECEIELEAQLAKFRAITGRDPDYFEGHAVFSNNFFIALKNVAQRNNLFFENPSLDKEWEKEFGITGLGFMSLDEHGLYDPRTYMEEHLDIIKNNPCAVAIFHPGFLDQYILEHSSFTLIRPMECDFLCSDWLSEWLNKNKIELVNFKNYK
ncbi:MAG: ChbG/HpnK family deacetylase [Thomasclavelia ramosa]